MNQLEEKIFEDRKLARELYYQVVLEKETAIKYRILNQQSFDNIKKRRDLNIKDGKYPTTIEYLREYKGYQVDVTSCFGFTYYMVNIIRPKSKWNLAQDNKYLHGELKPYAHYPSIYNKPFGMEYSDLIRVQKWIKFNLEEIEKLNCSDFIIEKDENWPCYFFNKGTDEIMCVSKRLENKNMKLEKI